MVGRNWPDDDLIEFMLLLLIGSALNISVGEYS